MTEPPPQLLGRWYHSFEDDTDEEEVWRPADYDFPRSRAPRPSIEFLPDGTWVEYRPGPADAEVPMPGRWELAGDDRIRVRAADGPRTLEIASHDQRTLRIRK